MHDAIPALMAPPRPTPERPLLGQTVLAVEDSRLAGEALRLMCLRSGARLRRADSLEAAARHLRTYRPTVVIADIGLPDGSGAALIAQLAAARPRVPVLLAISGDPAALDPALAAGADGVLTKPLASLAEFQNEILSRLPPDALPRGPRSIPDECIGPDLAALHDDLSHAGALLAGPESPGTTAYAAGFILGLGRSAGDGQLADTAEALCTACRQGAPLDHGRRALAALVHQRLSAAP